MKFDPGNLAEGAKGEEVTLVVGDDGVGLPQDLKTFYNFTPRSPPLPWAA